MKALKTIKRIMIVAIVAVASTFGVVAQTSNPGFNVIPDKSIATDDGIHITLCLVGIPSTSQRIDGIDLVDGTNVIPAADIDGIDFKRYFQFEDEGVQVVEVDFPYKGTLPKTATLVFHTEKGDIKAPAKQ